MTKAARATCAQLYGVSLRQLLGDDRHETFNGGHHVHRAQGRSLSRHLGHLARGYASAGLNGGVELLGGLTIARVASFNDIKFTDMIYVSY